MVAPKIYVHILTPGTYECELIWRKSYFVHSSFDGDVLE